MVENNVQLKSVLMGFVGLVLFIAFTTVIADNQVGNTELSNIQNEPITIIGGSGELLNDNIKSITLFGNGSNNTLINSNVILIGTHVNFTSNGTLQVVQNLNITPAGQATTGIVFANGEYNVSYTYGGDLYVDDASSRSLLNVTTVLWVLVGLGIAILAFMGASGKMSFGFGKN